MFPQAALASVVHSDRPPGGTGPAADAKRRIDGWLQGDAGERRAAQGDIDPAYRVLERRLREEFRPPKNIVKRSSWGGALRDQLKAFFGDPDRLRSDPESPVERAIAPREGLIGVPEGSNLRSLPLAQQQASMAAFYKPVWQVVDVEVALDRDGTLLGAWIVTSSGSRRLDRYALEQVRHVASERPESLPHSARIRYRLRASYVARIPTGLSLRFDETGNLDRRATGARRYVDVDNPAEEVKTEVQLLSIADH